MGSMVADAAARPDVLPTDRLGPTGVARPELRRDLRRIADARNASTVASLWAYVAAIVGGAVWLGTWWSLRRGLRAHGTDVRALRHPHARGGAQAPVHQQAGQRLGRDVADRLPGVHAHRAVPPRPLLPPPRGVRPRGARHRLLRRLPLRPGHPAPSPRCATRWASRAGRTSRALLRARARRRAPGPWCALDPRRRRPCCGRCRGLATGRGGSTRCCGGCRG